jgi:hypothetical protein
VNIFPRNAVFSEIHACYKASSELNPWMSARFLDERQFPTDDPSAFLIFWQVFPEGLVVPTKARKALRYTESMPVDPLRTENQKDHFQQFRNVACNLDRVIAHTPTAVNILGGYTNNVFLAPIGFEPSVYGVPDWTVPKTVDIGFYGSMVGKRPAVIDAVQERFGNRLRIINSFGWPRKRDLDRCRISLYVGHCEDPSFATTRLWQTIASSAALVMEDRDAWPATPGLHYVTIPRVDLSNLGGFLDSLERVLERSDLESVARTAFDDLSKFSVKECMERYVVPFARAT